MVVIYIMTTLTLTWCLLIFWFVTVSSGRKNPFGSLCCYFGGDPLCCWKSHRIIVVIIIIIVFIVIVIIAMIMINRVIPFGKSRSLRAWSRKSSRLILIEEINHHEQYQWGRCVSNEESCHPSDSSLNQTLPQWWSLIMTDLNIKVTMSSKLSGGRPQQRRRDWLLGVPHPRQGLVADLFLFGWVSSCEMLFQGRHLGLGSKRRKAFRQLLKVVLVLVHSSITCPNPYSIHLKCTNPFGYPSSFKELSSPVLSCLLKTIFLSRRRWSS